MSFKVRNLLAATLIAFVCATAASPQSVARQVGLRPFEPVEELFFEAELSRGLLRKLDVAEFRLKAKRSIETERAPVSESAQSGTDKLILTCEVASRGFFPKLFGLRFRETLESTIDPISFTVLNSKRVDEHGKRVRSSEAVFDQVHGKVSWTELDPKDPNRPPRIVSSEFDGSVHDILSAIYYLRTQSLQVGKGLELPISDSGQVYKVPVRVLEKKRLKTVLGRVDAILVEADLFGPGGMIDGNGKFFMWLTDDARRIPVSVKIKSQYGTFDIKLKKIVNTRGLARI